MGKKAFNQEHVDSVKRAIGMVIDPVLSDGQKDAIQPDSESGLRRGKPKVKKIPVKRKRAALL